MTSITDKPMRADARANREKILQNALELFAEQGPDASLNEVARCSGVGVGTLYRHFPTRDALVAEVYATELAALADAADELLAALGPDAALDEWGERFIGYASTKRCLGQTLLAIRDRGDLQVDAGTVIRGAIDQLLAAGREAGTIRTDADSDDVLRAFAGLWTMPSDDDFPVRARRLLAIVLGGLRHS